MSKFNSLTDVKTYIDNSGILNWEWDSTKYSDDEIIDNLLPDYIYSNCNDETEFDSELSNFIINVLNKNPKDYGI